MELRSTVCVVGGGPAGAMVGLLFARAGIDVILLEKHGDFLHDFRGDTVHPATLQVLDELGLTDKLTRLPYRRVRTLGVIEGRKRVDFADFGALRHRFPYIAFVPQWDFLNLITSEAARSSGFRLFMRSAADDLVLDNGRVAGVRFRNSEGDHTVRAALTIAADGRHSTLCRAAGLTRRTYGTPMDVVNFRVSRRDTDPDEGLCSHIGAGGKAVNVIDRGTYWHIVFEIAKGSWEELRTGEIESVRRDLAEMVPFLADRVDEITTPEKNRFLEVQMNRLHRWHRPGLLAIGDAAHAMSPVGGFGINLAVQDAVATANLLAGPLRRHQLHGTPIDDKTLAAVQTRRALPTAVAQAFQRLTQQKGFMKAQRHKSILDGLNPFTLAQFAFVRKLMAHMIGVGVRPEHVHPQLAAPPQE